MQENQIKLVAIKNNGTKFEKVLSKDNDTTTFNVFRKGLKALDERDFTRFSVLDHDDNVLFSTSIAKAIKEIRTSVDFFQIFASSEEKLMMKSISSKDVMIGDFYKAVKVDDIAPLLSVQTVKVIANDEISDDEEA